MYVYIYLYLYTLLARAFEQIFLNVILSRSSFPACVFVYPLARLCDVSRMDETYCRRETVIYRQVNNDRHFCSFISDID